MVQRSHIGFIHEVKGRNDIRRGAYRNKLTDILVFFHRSKQDQDGGQTGQRRGKIGFTTEGFPPHKTDKGGKDHHTAGNDRVLYRGGQGSQSNLTEKIADAIADSIAGQTKIQLFRLFWDALPRYGQLFSESPLHLRAGPTASHTRTRAARYQSDHHTDTEPWQADPGQAVMIFALSFGIATVASIIPILRIARQKPVDAIRKN